MALTDTAIKALKTKDKPYKAYDSDGLYLEITPSGGKLWRYRYRHDGKEKKIGLGKYPAITLAQARAKRDEAAKLAASGSDPVHDKRLRAQAKSIAATNSFAVVASDFIETRMVKGGKAPATIEKTRWCIGLLLPTLGTRPIADIKPAELLMVLQKIEGKGHRETAKRTLSLASQIFRFGIATVRCEGDPAALLKGALAPPVVKHRSSIIDPKRVGQFLRDMDGFTGTAIVKLAGQLLPHLALRPSEMRLGRWREINWDEAVWRIPAERTKLRRPHGVPLSTQAVALLRELGKLSNQEPGTLIFQSVSNHLRPMSENTLNQAYRRMGWGPDEVSAHGFRTTFSTLANQSGKWQKDAVERALAHGDSDVVRGIYNRADYWAERVEMMQWWSDYLDTLRSGAVILPFNSARAAP